MTNTKKMDIEEAKSRKGKLGMSNIEFDTMYSMSERAAQIVEANFQTWLGLQGYVMQEEDGSTTEQYIKDTPISEFLHDLFWKKIRSKEGFNYVTDLLAPLASGIVYPLKDRTAYHMIEGYGMNYADIMRNTGFDKQASMSFEEIDALHGGVVGSN